MLAAGCLAVSGAALINLVADEHHQVRLEMAHAAHDVGMREAEVIVAGEARDNDRLDERGCRDAGVVDQCGEHLPDGDEDQRSSQPDRKRVRGAGSFTSPALSGRGLSALTANPRDRARGPLAELYSSSEECR